MNYLNVDHYYEWSFHHLGGLFTFFKMSCKVYRKIPKRSPAAEMQKELRKLMEEKGLWEETLLSDIPNSWEKYGDLLLFNGEKYFRDGRWLQVESLWQCVCRILRAKRVALKHFISEDSFRSPNVRMVYGANTWIEYKDNSIIYCWDIQSNMFCAGNAPERHRIATFKCEDETVVDMYAGIGYFTLPYLVKAKAKLVHACEWNPRAIKALKLNLRKNNVVDCCIVHEGDNRLVCPKHVADRVNLGLLPSSESGWETACNALKPYSGGILHIHENVVSGIKSKEKTNEGFYCDLLACETCEAILKECNSNEKDITKSKFYCDLESQSSFSLQFNLVNDTKEVLIKWKHPEWKIWALHVCHKLRDIFLSIHEKPWNIGVCNMQHVKSYAPHIDHLVLDVKCTPLVNSLK